MSVGADFHQLSEKRRQEEAQRLFCDCGAYNEGYALFRRSFPNLPPTEHIDYFETAFSWGWTRALKWQRESVEAPAFDLDASG